MERRGAAGQRTVGLGKRFGARLIDSIIVGVVVVVIIWLIPGLTVRGALGSVISTLAGYAYFVLLEGGSGQTLMKRAFGIKVVSASGGPATMEAAAKRNAWLLIGLLGIIPIVSFFSGLASLAIAIWIMVTISSNAGNRGVHDIWGDTLVVEAR